MDTARHGFALVFDAAADEVRCTLRPLTHSECGCGCDSDSDPCACGTTQVFSVTAPSHSLAFSLGARLARMIVELRRGGDI